MAGEEQRYRPIGDYALIGDCHQAALVSAEGSIDWCCMPRMDAGSVFGRLLDAEDGGFCSVTPDQECDLARYYQDGTLVLETVFRAASGEARLVDCFTMRPGGALDPERHLLRTVVGVRGWMSFRLRLAARLDYGLVKPWLRRLGISRYAAVGGNDALLVWSDAELGRVGEHELEARFAVRAGQRVHLSVRYVEAAALDRKLPDPPESEQLDRRLEETAAWWRHWSDRVRLAGPDEPAAERSAIVLKALQNAPTGAITAAPTTSLPETLDGDRNWDYRMSWIRDSTFTARSLAALGCTREADGFRRFVERSSAGSTGGLQVCYGLGGERRLTEEVLDHLEGYRGVGSVRVGNAAAKQEQLDVYGEVLDLAWRWHQRGSSPDDDYWRFLLDLVDAAAENWKQPDRGFWEVRGEPRHFTHSKVLCWAALDRGVRLAESCVRAAPVRRWARTRDEIRAAVEREGFDAQRGVFVRSFGDTELDTTLLLLPNVDFVTHDDPRMVATCDAIRDELDDGYGLLRRYTSDDLSGHEGAFVSCSFWLVECLARQDRLEEARALFDRATACGNALGLLAEEYDSESGELRGNFPQGLSHLSHIAAAVALADATAPMRPSPARR